MTLKVQINQQQSSWIWFKFFFSFRNYQFRRNWHFNGQQRWNHRIAFSLSPINTNRRCFRREQENIRGWHIWRTRKNFVNKIPERDRSLITGFSYFYTFSDKLIYKFNVYYQNNKNFQMKQQIVYNIILCHYSKPISKIWNEYVTC